MIPIGDVIPSRTRPVVTATLIFLMSVAFVTGRLVPQSDAHALASGDADGWPGWIEWLVSLFLHSGWVHALSNLAVLWIFGRSVEDRFGHIRFLIFYLLAGILAAAAASTRGPAALAVPLGASGAVAAVMGAHLVLFPRARVLVLTFVFALDIIEVPALIVMGLWFLIQLADAATASLTGAGADIALLARLAGLGAGLGLVWIFRRKDRESINN